MINWIREKLGINALQGHLKLHDAVTSALAQKVRVLEAVAGAQTLAFHKRAMHRKESKRYDELERERKLRRKG
jgi:hypothetical protein